MTSVASWTRPDEVRSAVDRLVDTLATQRRDDGSWSGHLPSSAVSTGAAVLALDASHGPRGACRDGLVWLLEQQHEEGGWGDAPAAPRSLNATAIGLAALATGVRAGDDVPGLETGLRRARAAIAELGGDDAVADKARCSLKTVCEFFLAAAGEYDADRLALLPHELGLLPRRWWNKLSFTVPGLMAWGLMQAEADGAPWPRRFLSRWARPRALAYLRDIHEHESGHPTRLGGIEESALMASVVCWGLARAGHGDDLVAAYRDYLLATVRHDGSWPIDRDIEHSVTTYLAQPLHVLGQDDAARSIDLQPTRAWVREGQRHRPFAATGVPAGGWGWAVPSGWPDVDDTACAVTVLAQGGAGPDDPAVRAGLDFLHALQNRNGSWGCFARHAPAAMDAPCAVMTAHALDALAAAGTPASAPVVRRAVAWLGSAQQPAGWLANVWFRGRTPGTARAAEALQALGLGDHDVAVRARAWLRSTQLADGGWGDGWDDVQGSDGSATVEHTAWALLALQPPVGPGRPEDEEAVAAGVDWLLRAQRADGTFAPALVGIYFLGLTYHCDRVADAYALAALVRHDLTRPSRS